jgi:hypothetical protein
MKVERIEYHGWPNCLRLSNGVAEAMVVPAIGRIMQFRFLGDEPGPFWENCELYGRYGTAANGDDWLNFGGDKTWPSPQGDWEKQTGRTWPPPAAFDSLPYEAEAHDDQVLLTSQADPHYGMKAVRRLTLASEEPRLEITTEFHKLAGKASRVGVWVITQFREPERVFGLLPERPRLPQGYVQQMGGAPKDLERDGRLLSLKRHSSETIKIGTVATSLLWMDARVALAINAQDSPGEYPNGGSSTEIYTNPDPLPYVELETEGPLKILEAGDRMAQTNAYTLHHRSCPDCFLEARRLFGLCVPG